jgi:CubicO group peptidase (beta-lactamase class C family)
MSEILKDADFYRSGYHAHGYAALCEGIRKLAWRYGSLLRDYRCHNNPILVKHHITHTSQARPGRRYKYNGFLFSFLTEVVEQVSQKPFEEMLVERTIAPFEMMDTVPSINAERRKQALLRRANYYRLNMFGRPVPSNQAAIGTVRFGRNDFHGHRHRQIRCRHGQGFDCITKYKRNDARANHLNKRARAAIRYWLVCSALQGHEADLALWTCAHGLLVFDPQIA